MFFINNGFYEFFLNKKVYKLTLVCLVGDEE
ncbi:Uncharacterised protein [Weeksella virosa]|nr:Uncharacterised protein [Weeksella virosa]